VSRGRLRHRLEHDADRIGYESRRRILPERVIRLRTQGDLDGLRQVVFLGDGHRLLVRQHLQFAGRLACLALGGADLGAQRVGSDFNDWSFSDEEFDDNAEEQPVSETPTTAATTTESPTRDMTSLLPLLCVTQPSRGAPFSQSEIGSCTLRFVKGPKDWLKAAGSEAGGRRGLGALGNGS
jgi:hypothetical protein